MCLNFRHINLQCGISLFTSNIFGESGFLSAYATDRPSPHALLNLNNSTLSASEIIEENSSELSSTLCPKDVKPFPKAVSRKENIVKSGKKKIEIKILTCIPEKKGIEQATTIMSENKT